MFGIPQVYIYLALGAGSLALGAAGAYSIQESRVKTLKAEVSLAQAEATKQAALLSEERVKSAEKIDAEKAKRDEQEAIAFAAADDVIGGLRTKVSNLTARINNSCASRNSETIKPLGAVFSACVEEYKALGKDAGGSYSKGLAVEERYDSLRASKIGK